MFHLRTLVIPIGFLAVIAGLLSADDALALQQEVSSTYSLNSASGSPGQTTLVGPGSGRVSSMNANFSYLLDGIWNHFNASGGVTLAQPNYQNYLLRNSRGDTRSLSDSVKSSTEITGTQAFGWSHGIHTANMTWAGSLNQSPFSFQSATASYQMSFFEKATVLGVRATLLNQDNPEDFFIDRRFQNQSRPRLIHANEVVGTYDQILTDRWKMFVDLSTARRIEERPRNIGITLGHAYALSNRVSLQVKAARFEELRSDPLLNERGYFNLTSGEFAVGVEPIYDLLVTLSYGLTVEREYDPSTQAETQVATDQFGLGLRYTLRSYEIRIQGGLGATNTTYQTLNFSGGVVWRI